MGSKTLLTKAQQEARLENIQTSYCHKWSTRGMGNSRIVGAFNQVNYAKASGCGYDRYGAALGEFIESMFQSELNQLGKKLCKGKRGDTRKTAKEYYGLFYNSVTGRAYVDGACGSECMRAILNKIGFTWRYQGNDSRSNNGTEFYLLEPIDRHEYKYLR